MTSHIYIFNVFIYINIYEYVRMIFLTFLSIFSIYEDAYVNVNSLYIKFFIAFSYLMYHLLPFHLSCFYHLYHLLMS